MEQGGGDAAGRRRDLIPQSGRELRRKPTFSHWSLTKKFRMRGRMVRDRQEAVTNIEGSRFGGVRS
jgi:hypothetical protein